MYYPEYGQLLTPCTGAAAVKWHYNIENGGGNETILLLER